MMKLFFPLVTLFFIGANVSVAQSGNSCKDDSLYHLLDFWVGNWEVYAGDSLVGNNRIEKILNDCAVMEHWMSAAGTEGKSLFYVDNTGKSWEQVWITEDATKPWGQKEKTLINYEQDSMLIFQGKYIVQGQEILDRTTITKISPEEVTQRIEISSDGGKSWKTVFTGKYIRR